FASRLAEVLDDVGGAGARLAERDPAVLAQRELLALQHDLRLVDDRDERPVRAVVAEQEPVLAPLDRAMLPRGLRVRHHEIAARVAPDQERVAPAPPRD